jgi:hypothetical protein
VGEAGAVPSGTLSPVRAPSGGAATAAYGRASYRSGSEDRCRHPTLFPLPAGHRAPQTAQPSIPSSVRGTKAACPTLNNSTDRAVLTGQLLDSLAELRIPPSSRQPGGTPQGNSRRSDAAATRAEGSPCGAGLLSRQVERHVPSFVVVLAAEGQGALRNLEALGDGRAKGRRSASPWSRPTNDPTPKNSSLQPPCRPGQSVLVRRCGPETVTSVHRACRRLWGDQAGGLLYRAYLSGGRRAPRARLEDLVDGDPRGAATQGRSCRTRLDMGGPRRPLDPPVSRHVRGARSCPQGKQDEQGP